MVGIVDCPAIAPRQPVRSSARGGQMRIAVFGTGGAGGYFGAQLALAGEDVVFVARGDHLRAIRATGLRLETPSGETIIRAQATDNPAETPDVDAVLVG